MTSFKKEAKLKLTSVIQSIAKESKDQILSSLGGKPVEPEELKNLLRLKADKDDLFKMDITKADKNDIKNSLSIIEILHSQVSHIWLILCEFFKLESEKEWDQVHMTSNQMTNHIK